MTEINILRLKNENSIIDKLDSYISKNLPDDIVLISQITSKILIVLIIFLILDFFQRKVLLKIALKIVPKTKNILMNTFIKKMYLQAFFDYFL